MAQTTCFRNFGGVALCALAVHLSLTGAAAAQSADPVSVDTIQRSLLLDEGPAASGPSETTTAEAINRIITLEIPATETGDGDVVPATTVQIDSGRTIDLDILFPYNSAEISPGAREQLMNLGIALVKAKAPMPRLLVAGHTDAAGSNQYNISLSEQRAKSVKGFLTETFGIPADRLHAVGFGEERLADQANPYDGANRRVEITVLVE